MSFIKQKSKAIAAFVCLLLCQTVLYAQVNVTIPKGEITITEALKQIEKQSKKSIAYNASRLKGSKPILLDVQDQPLEVALEKTLAGTNFTYQIDGDYIMIVDKTQQEVQNKSIKGVIIDREADNEPLIGVNISIKGGTAGTITNVNGEFSFSNVKKGDVLEISYIGYKTTYVTITDKTNYTINLNTDTQLLSEVVVTALGIKREQKALSYNVQEVKSDALLTNKDANFMNSLNGKVAGVTINSSSSGVGGATKVVMRGTKSINQSSNALYVIDGIPMYNTAKEGGTEFNSSGSTESIADLNPEDIESMSVLTGAAAAALYGSQGANGAVVITTKKGKAGQTSIVVTQSTDFLSAYQMPKFQNSYGAGSKSNAKDMSWGKELNDVNRNAYNPKDDFFKTGVVATEAVSFQTGTDKNQTYLSAAAVNSIGITPNNEYNRYNFTFRNTTSFLEDKMTLDVGGSYIKQNDLNMVNQGVYSNPLVTAYLFPRGNDWNDVKMYERYDASRKIMTQHWPYGIAEFTGQNPYWIANRNLRENKKDRYMFNAGLSYDILDWLNVSGRVRIDNSVNDFTEKLYATSNKTLIEGSNNGLYGITTQKNKQTYADLLVNMSKTFENQISIQANIGTSYSDLREDLIQNRGPIAVGGIPNLFNVFQLDNNTTKRIQQGWHEQTQSIFASAEVGYKGAYYLTVTGRNDWPSQLAGPNSSKKSFFYPSFGASIVLSEIINMPKQIEYLKIRSSFASVGLPFSRFLANPTYAWNDATNSWSMFKRNYPIHNLKPETNNSWEVGLTARFLKYFSLDFSFYNTKTYNQTFDPQISASSGYTTIFIQTGNVLNRGIELALGFDKDWKDFRWSSNFTLSHNKNKIIELVDNFKHPLTGEYINKDRLDIAGLAKARFILKKGGGLGDLYSISDLKRDDNGNIFIDENGNVTTVNSADIKLGTIFPKANLAWRNDFKYKGFNAGVMLTARIGGVAYSATQAALDNYGVSKYSADARQAGGVVIHGGDVMDPEKWFTAIGSQSGMPQYYTYSATNVRLQEASLGYTFTKNKLWNVGDLTVSVVGKNLWMIYNRAPFDPESVASTGNYYQGIDYFMMPSTRNIGFNVRLKF